MPIRQFIQRDKKNNITKTQRNNLDFLAIAGICDVEKNSIEVCKEKGKIV